MESLVEIVERQRSRDLVAAARFAPVRNCAPVGARNRNRRSLLACQVVEIRRRAAAGETRRELSEAFGVSTGTIGKVLARQIYRWVRDPTP